MVIEEITKLLKYIKSGKVLDLGCGKGENSIFLLKKGFDVVGVDCKVKNVDNIKFFNEDITHFDFKDYDVILCNYVLNFLDRKDILKMIGKIKKHTEKNGINVISVFTIDNPNKNFKYLFKEKELKEFYKDWKILEYKKFITPVETHGIEPHRHAVAYLIARKV